MYLIVLIVLGAAAYYYRVPIRAWIAAKLAKPVPPPPTTPEPKP